MEFILNENVLAADVQPGAGFESSQGGGLTRKKRCFIVIFIVYLS